MPPSVTNGIKALVKNTALHTTLLEHTTIGEDTEESAPDTHRRRVEYAPTGAYRMNRGRITLHAGRLSAQSDDAAPVAEARLARHRDRERTVTMLFATLVDTSMSVAETPKRTAKIEHLATLVRDLAAEEVEAAIAYLCGELRQRQIGVGFASLRDLPAPAAQPTLSITDVDEACAAIGMAAGAGVTSVRRRLLEGLFGRATEPEQAFLRRLFTGGIRQGALEGVMVEAVARAVAIPPAEVRRALMLAGTLGMVAAVAREHGSAGLAAIRLEVGRPILPMLAETATDVAEAVGRFGAASVEYKLDGARVQLHRSGEAVRVFTRTLADTTPSMPQLVATARSLAVQSVVIDGEVIALRDDGRPEPFQVTSSRFARRNHRDQQPRMLALFAFDLLQLNGEDLLNRPASERLAALDSVVPAQLRVPRIATDNADKAQAFMDAALAAGHEGVMVKSLEAGYEAGRRGASWLKVKPHHTLDLVVLAAEWGHGRRRGWLSNLHLGARDPATGGFVMLGKTFKGLTDAMLAWQTQALLDIATDRGDWIVRVRPSLVVEIAFDGVQASTRYPGGVALRFARVKGYRPDKSPAEADTITTVRSLHERGLA